MKPIRRLLFLLSVLLGTIIFAMSIMFVAPLQYLFTGKTDLVYDITDWLDRISNNINPDKE